MDYLGFQFEVTTDHDEDVGYPWEECDGHGAVRECEKHRYTGHLEKRPGERPLYIGDRRERSFVYDWQRAIRTALRESWGCKDGRKPGETARQYAARAVQADFDYLRQYCSGHWHYVVLCVSHDGETAYLGGIESGDRARIEECAQELAHEILERLGKLPEQRAAAWREALREARERKYWEQRDMVTV